jgi:putative heme-binding domain-containing protein
LLELLKRHESMHRYRAKRELRSRSPQEVQAALGAWIQRLDRQDPGYRHHQLEALWTSRMIGRTRLDLIRELIHCDQAPARAAAIQQLRYAHEEMEDAIGLLRIGMHDPDALVRMEAVIAASYIGNQSALEALLEVFQHPMGEHLSYAVACSLGSHTLRSLWEANDSYGVAGLLRQLQRVSEIREPKTSARDAAFDGRPNLQTVHIGCEPERMLFTVKEFTAAPGQSIKLVFTNADATDHNLVIVRPGALEKVGVAANNMAKDPRNANSDFVPPNELASILHATRMIGPTRASRIHVLRFQAPQEPGVYPYVCTFPGHWIIMNGQMIVGRDSQEIESLRSSQLPKIVREWAMKDLADLFLKASATAPDEAVLMRGMQAFVKAQCLQCHQVSGHGVNLGPDLAESVKKFKGSQLLQHIIEPSLEIHPKYQLVQFLLGDDQTITGVVDREDDQSIYVLRNLLAPQTATRIAKRDIEQRKGLRVSAMPAGLLNVLTKAEILDLIQYLESGPAPLHQHQDDH